MKILFLDQPHPVMEEKLSALGFTIESDLTSSLQGVEKKIGEYIGVVMRSRLTLTHSFIDKARHLKFIAREGVGLEHIPVTYAESKGIQVLVSPEGSRDTVGEHATGLLLMLLNNLGRADREIRAGQWVREGNRGVELRHKTVGIIGYGNMGTAFARKISGFEAEVIAYDKFKENYGDAFAKAVSLEAVFDRADIISVHIPYSPENHYFINHAFLQKFRKNIYLVNTARGLVLNTADLVANLKSGKVSGAALDVLEYEDQSFSKFSLQEMTDDFAYLIQAPNVVLSPHIAGWSFESKKKHAEVLVEKIKHLLLSHI